MRWTVRHILTRACLISCLLMLTSTGRAADPVADSPEAAVREMEAASKAGDLPRMAAVLAEPGRSLLRDAADVGTKLDAAHGDLLAALDAKFGPARDDNGYPFGSAGVGRGMSFVSAEGLRHQFSGLISFTIQKAEPLADGRVRLTVAMKERTPEPGRTRSMEMILIASREQAGPWRLLPGPLEGKSDDEITALRAEKVGAVEKLLTAYADAQAAVKAGGIPSRDDANKRMIAAWEQHVPGVKLPDIDAAVPSRIKDELAKMPELKLDDLARDIDLARDVNWPKLEDVQRELLEAATRPSALDDVPDVRFDLATTQPSLLLTPSTQPALGTGTGGAGSVNAAGLEGRQRERCAFFGIETKARDVVYVCDGSNAVIGRFAGIRHELRKSIAALQPAQRFNIIFARGGKAHAMRPALVPATADNKLAAYRFLDDLVSEGLSDPKAALELAIRLRPQVVYLATFAFENARAFATTVRELRQASRQPVKIHTLAFGLDLDPHDKLWIETLRNIARDSEGEFKEVTDE